jgi:hypothetical protein
VNAKNGASVIKGSVSVMNVDVSMMNGSVEKMNDTNEKCGDVIMRVNGNGTTVRKEKGSAIIMNSVQSPPF